MPFANEAEGRHGKVLLEGKRFAVPTWTAAPPPKVVTWTAAGPSETSGPFDAAQHGHRLLLHQRVGTRGRGFRRTVGAAHLQAQGAAIDAAEVVVLDVDGTLVAEIDDGDHPRDHVPGWLDVLREVTLDEEWTGAGLARRLSPPA